MTPKFGHESAASNQSHKAKASKTSRDGNGGDDLDDLIDDISGKDVGSIGGGSFKYTAPATITTASH